MTHQREYVIEITEEVSKCAGKMGLDDECAKQLAALIVKSLTYRWGGLSIYFANDSQNVKAKHEEIAREYDGKNTRQLAKKYGLSQQWIYRIIKDRQVANLQPVIK